MALVYLNINIGPFEEAIHEAVTEARKLAKNKYPNWRLAKKGLEEMPSAKEKVWKFDMWLPRAVALAEGYDEDHPWFTALENYSNADSATTIALFKEQRKRLKSRNLWKIYLERL